MRTETTTQPNFKEGEVFTQVLGSATVKGVLLESELWFGLSGIMRFLDYKEVDGKEYARKLKPNSRSHKMGNSSLWVVNKSGMESLLIIKREDISAEQLKALYRDLFNSRPPCLSSQKFKYEYFITQTQMTEIIREIVRSKTNKSKVISMLLNTKQ